MTSPLVRLRRAWRRLPLPNSLRASVVQPFWASVHAVSAARLSRAPPIAVRPGPVRVAGFLSATHGIAASAHRCIEALRALGLDPIPFDIGLQDPERLLRCDLSKERCEGGAWIVHANAPETVLALSMIGRRNLTGAFIAGYWAYELPRAPPDWFRRQQFLSEIWTPSTFVRDAVSAPGVTVRVVPHLVTAPNGLDRDAIRLQLGIHPRSFLATSFFDMSSSMARKNPLGAITAFKSAFGPDDEALLLLKVQRGESRPDRLRELKQAANRPGGRVTIVDATWPADQTRALIASSDVVISLHRAEGFGLVIAESMIADVPVIATGWSGNLDFMSPEYPGLVPYRLQPVSDPQGIYRSQAWAEPDTTAAAALLTRVRHDRQFRYDMIETGRALVADRLSQKAYAASLGPAFWASTGTENVPLLR